MYVRDVVRALAPHVQPQRHLIVSIAAGVNLQSIEELLPAETRVVRHLVSADDRQMTSCGRSLKTTLWCVQVRVMPNTPCLIGQAASAYCCGSHATPEDDETVFALLSSVGAPRPSGC